MTGRVVPTACYAASSQQFRSNMALIGLKALSFAVEGHERKAESILKEMRRVWRRYEGRR